MRLRLMMAAAALAVATGAPVGAQETVVKIVQDGCQEELKSYCAQVTPGRGRVLACLYAHGDKLSGACEFALYDAAVQLERAVAALTYVAKECDDDVDQLCADVEMGDGRIVTCLNENEAKISARCNRALSDVGLK